MNIFELSSNYGIIYNKIGDYMKKGQSGQTQTITTINTMEDAMSYLSSSVTQVSYDVNNINLQVDDVQSQVNDMKNNVKSLENEVRVFMQEMKKNVMVNDAKQTIMMTQIEYDKKYKHHDDVRRRIVGMLQSIDINVIKKSTMETISEETIMNNPDYWLANALVALCHWYGNNFELAQAALAKALKNSDEKTSFLFCLIHLRGNRIKTAVKWLKRYLSLQDPTNMDCKIILLLDALCSGIFDKEVIDVILNQIKEWENKLNNYPQYENNQITVWEKYFKDKIKFIPSQYGYINDFVAEKDKVNNKINSSKSNINMIKEFKQMIQQIDNTNSNHQNKIDKLINLLIFDYEKEELDLKIEIDKNNAIINSESIENIDTELKIYNKNDLYTHISNICLDENIFDVGIYTKKMAVSMLKKYIILAYKNTCNMDDKTLTYLSIVIDDWAGITKNGDNEFELKKSLSNHVQKKHQEEFKQTKLIDTKMILSVIAAIIIIVLFRKYPLIILLTIIALIIFNGYMYYKKHKFIKDKQAIIDKEKENASTLLMCTISDIVDYNIECNEHNEEHDNFIKYLSSLDYSEYIRAYTENKRNIIIGEKR